MNLETSDNKFQLPKTLNLINDFPIPSYDEWKEKVEKDLRGKPFKKLITKTIEGIELQPIYTRKDLEKNSHQDLYPGSGSTRATNASGYFGSEWIINQRIELADADEFNSALKDALERGQNSIYISLDKASTLGLDADYAKTEDVGNGGLSISGLSSFSRALKDVDITKHPISIGAGFSSIPFISILSAYCKKNNIDISKVSGSIEADPIGYWASEGELPIPLSSAISELKISLDWKIKNAPNFRTINVNSLPYINSGANAVQELAFVLATAAEYIRKLIDLGADINDIAKNIKVTLGIGSSFFTEVSKFRSIKLLWKNLISAFGGNDESQNVNIFAVSSNFNKTKFDPYVNMLRTTTETFSAIVGGINSLQVSPFDSVFSIPDNFSRRIARNTQIILKEESHLNTPIDSAGGSYYVEHLTEELAVKAWEKFQQIEKNGGMIESLKNNLIQNDINSIYQTRAKGIGTRKSKIVGTNVYANPTEELIKSRKVNNAEIQKNRAEFLQKFRVSKNQSSNEEILTALDKLSKECNNESIDIAATAILNGATLGEITNSCRVNMNDVERVKITPIKIRRAAEPFEELRIRANKIEVASGKKPSVFLATMGSLKEFKGRADFSRSFFEVGGFDVHYPNGFTTCDEAITAIKKADVKIVIICSTDEKYRELVPELTSKLEEEFNDVTIVLAGYPKEQIEEYRNNGVDEFIFIGADAYSILSKMLNNYLLEEK
ncbi:MAG: acyl-CoA mutase large subunit family protein [Melioribacteraceae bacterium]|nr:acyl-CoA mutase large subunit family protein [Melioribacteraceae bacterium]